MSKFFNTIFLRDQEPPRKYDDYKYEPKYDRYKNYTYEPKVKQDGYKEQPTNDRNQRLTEEDCRSRQYTLSYFRY